MKSMFLAFLLFSILEYLHQYHQQISYQCGHYQRTIRTGSESVLDYWCKVVCGAIAKT
jgi:hypothetical protein